MRKAIYYMAWGTNNSAFIDFLIIQNQQACYAYDGENNNTKQCNDTTLK